MICNVCGSEFSLENFDMCPYCLTPVQNIAIQDDKIENEPIIREEPLECEKIQAQTEIIEPNTELHAELYDDYEVTADDLLEEQEDSEEVILVDELDLSVRAVNAFHRAKIFTLNELIEFLSTNSVADLKNVGAKTVQETEELMGQILSGNLCLVKKNNKEDENSEKSLFAKMSADVDFLSIDALGELGLSKKTVSCFINNDIKCCESLRRLTKKDFLKIIGKRNMDKLPDVATLLENDIIYLIEYVFNNYIGTREYNVILRRAKGETLQEIALNPEDNEGVITRERVRQIENKTVRAFVPFVRELLYILKGSNNFILIEDILDIYDNDEYDQILLYIAKSFEEFEYLDFAEVFGEKREQASIEQTLLDGLTEIIGDGIDLYENKEVIEELLVENGCDYIDIDGIIRLLKKNNYTIYGSFAVKGKANYATICMYVVRKYFSEGIKLSQSDSEQSEDLIELRRIIANKYAGVSIPQSDRALSSTLARSGLILRGRGTYIPQENVNIDESILKEIKSYIDKKSTDRIFYSEIYTEFEGVLNLMYGIDNHNYLHGILAMRYPDNYEYLKDYLLKNGVADGQADSIADRIYAFICREGRPVSKSELIQEFRGFSNVMIIMPFVNDERLMQWDYNYYACTGILNITENDIYDLRNCIEELFDANNGYTSDGLLYEKISEELPDFIEKNPISTEMNLHYVVSKLFSNEMDFRRPHIGEKGRLDISSTKSVALYLLDNPEKFSYEQYMDVCERMKWSRVTAGLVFHEIEEDYVRLSVNDYIKKELFAITDEILEKTHQIIDMRVENGILSLINIELDDFPDCDYQWNEFILEDIVRIYFDDYIIIQPSARDRRYQRGIIVKKELKIESYPQIVSRVMIEKGCNVMTESQFLSFLVVHNLARMVIPNELTDSDYVKKDGEYFKAI